MINKEIRLHIFGASGAGVSTLGKILSKETNIPNYDFDDYYWEQTNPPFTTKREYSKRYSMLQGDIRDKYSYIISGHYGVEYTELDANLTHAIFVYASCEMRIQRLQQRERLHFGDRIDKGGDMHQGYLEFMDWAKGYDASNKEGRNLQKHKQRIKLLNCPILHLDGEKDLKEKLVQSLDFLQK